VISVGALNPDGTVALFSNAGDWVLSTETGAGVVSTFPKFDAAGHAAYAFEDAGSVRSTIDPDNFASGFGIWSGTSFAAPVLAGKIAQSLADGSCGSTEALDPKSMLDRAWNAVAAHTKLRRQP
jgi:subtilisin family serine protease